MDRQKWLETLIKVPRMRDCQVSPDGRYVAWTWWGLTPGANVYLAPSDGRKPPQALTDTEGDTRMVSWAPDSQSVVVSEDPCRDERIHLTRVGLSPSSTPEVLTEKKPSFYLRGGEIHPQGEWLYYGANFDMARGEEIEATWIYGQHLSTGEKKILARPECGGYLRPRLNREGTHLIYPRKDLHPAGQQIWLVDIEGREDREILNFGPFTKVQARWTGDGQSVAFLAEADDYRRLGLWHRESLQIEWLVDMPSRNIEEIYSPWGTDFLVIIEREFTQVKASILNYKTREEEHMEGQSPGDLQPLAPLFDSQEEWIGLYSHSTYPTDVVRFSPSASQVEDFSSISQIWDQMEVTSGDLISAEDFRWEGEDGLELQGWVYETEKFPVQGTIVLIHGGPTGHFANEFHPQIQFFAHCGFNVFCPNYRGSTGFGMGFQEAIKEDGWGGKEQEDIKRGIQELIRQQLAWEGMVGVMGTSYGGYSAWCQITRYPTKWVAAAVPICAMTDLVIDYETTRPDLRPYSEAMMGGSPQTLPEKYHQRSPIHFVENIEGNLLIVQGMKDPNVTPENTEAICRALEEKGVAYEKLIFDDEGHGIYKPENLQELTLKAADFFQRSFEEFKP